MALRSTWVSIESEAVTDLLHSHIERNTSKAKSRKHFAVVIRFDNLSYCLNSLQVTIERLHSVERLRMSEWSIRGGKVDSYRQRNLDSRSKDLYKSWSFNKLEMIYSDKPSVTSIV